MPTDVEHVINMTQSDGWKIVHEKLLARIAALSDIRNIDLTLPLDVQLRGNLLAQEQIQAWLKVDVFGFIEQHQPGSQPETHTQFISRQ